MKRRLFVTMAVSCALLPLACSRREGDDRTRAKDGPGAPAKPTQPATERAGCESNLVFFAEALKQYASRHDGEMPLNVLFFAEAASPDVRRFKCPSGRAELAQAPDPDSWGDYVFPSMGAKNVAPTQIVAYCRGCLALYGETAAARADGSVTRLSAAALAERLAAQEAASAPRTRFDPQAENSGGFRGPNRDGRFPASGLLTRWPEGGPKLAWKKTIARGWTAASVAGGSVFFCGAALTGTMWAFSLDGELRWVTNYGPEGAKAQAQPRATPAVAAGRIFYTSMMGVLTCLDAADGKVLWRTDLRPLGGGGTSASPLVCGDNVVVSICSRSADVPCFLAFRTRDGTLAWKGNFGPCPEEGKGWSNFHSSPILVHAEGRRLVVDQFFRCLGAVDAETGEKVWVQLTTGYSTSPTSHEGYLLMQGRRMLKVLRDGNVEELWQKDLGIKEYGVSYSHSTIANGRVYVFTPGAVKMFDARTGAELARSPCGGSGSLQMAEGLLYVLDGRPRVTLIRPTDAALEQVSSFTPDIPGGRELYTHAVIAEGRLFLRNHTEVRVYDLRAAK
jgi:hypothetical protein